MSEVEVVIHRSKFCPFRREECNREGCRLWSEAFEACGVGVNHLALVRVADALREVVAFMSLITKEQGNGDHGNPGSSGDGADCGQGDGARDLAVQD